MLRRLRRRLTYANVTSTLALFLVVAGGTAWATHETILSSDIVDNEVRSADVRDDTASGGGLSGGDIANGAMTTLEIRDDNQPFGGLFAQDLAAGSVRSTEVLDGSLTGSDVSDGTVTAKDIGYFSSSDFSVNIGTVPATTCVYRSVPLPPFTPKGNYLLLTPNLDSAHGALIYNARYTSNDVVIHVCNFSNASADDGTTFFSLIEIVH